MDVGRLRNAIQGPIEALSQSNGHKDLVGICESLGLPDPPAQEAGTKRERMLASFSDLPDADVPTVAQRLLVQHPVLPGLRNEIQDLLWADRNTPAIPKRFRREVARAIGSSCALYESTDQFHAALEEVWVLYDELTFGEFLSDRRSLGGQIEQHMYRNDDWTVEYLFEQLGALEASDRRFALFLERLSLSDIRPDIAAQREFVAVVNGVLEACGVELRETDEDGGYPVFSIVSKGSRPAGRPKNLVFASQEKPDIRIREAVNNDIEIVGNADKVLVYDQPIGSGGLRWRDLQAWWAEREGLENNDEARRNLYRRLRDSLPGKDVSPPQRLLFRSFHEIFADGFADLPALLPEVWLHWDPKTYRERGPDALLRLRMDFLMLFPNGPRVVIEVDGKQHYADGDTASPKRYAKLAEADRELRLASYEVYHFGGSELQDSSGVLKVREFFVSLFNMHGLSSKPTV